MLIRMEKKIINLCKIKQFLKTIQLWTCVKLEFWLNINTVQKDIENMKYSIPFTAVNSLFWKIKYTTVQTRI